MQLNTVACTISGLPEPVNVAFAALRSVRAQLPVVGDAGSRARLSFYLKQCQALLEAVRSCELVALFDGVSDVDFLTAFQACECALREVYSAAICSVYFHFTTNLSLFHRP